MAKTDQSLTLTLTIYLQNMIIRRPYAFPSYHRTRCETIYLLELGASASMNVSSINCAFLTIALLFVFIFSKRCSFINTITIRCVDCLIYIVSNWFFSTYIAAV